MNLILVPLKLLLSLLFPFTQDGVPGLELGNVTSLEADRWFLGVGKSRLLIPRMNDVARVNNNRITPD